MLRTALLLALLAPPEPSCPAQPERVFLGAVVTNPEFQHRVVETCGLVQGPGERAPGERVMHASSANTDFWMFVFEGEAPLAAEGSTTCIVGTYRRRDGLTPAEVRARGLGEMGAADGLQRPNWVFYPLRCTYDGPALG